MVSQGGVNETSPRDQGPFGWRGTVEKQEQPGDGPNRIAASARGRRLMKGGGEGAKGGGWRRETKIARAHAKNGGDEKKKDCSVWAAGRG